MPGPPPSQWCAMVSKKELIVFSSSAEREFRIRLPERVGGTPFPPPSGPSRSVRNLGAALRIGNRAPAPVARHLPAQEGGSRMRARLRVLGSRPDGARDPLSQD